MGRTKQQKQEKSSKKKTNQKVVNEILEKTKKSSKKQKESTQLNGELQLFPTASALMNCACSDSVFGAFAYGTMVNIIGDSSAGKSIFSLEILAILSQYEQYNDYRFIYDDAENADQFDKENLFGSKLTERLEPPDKEKDSSPLFSDTIEDFHCNVLNAVDEGKPFIYILDSFDALDSEQDQKKVEQMRSDRMRGKKGTGSYGMSKPKKASELLRGICAKLKKTNSLLIIISQTRDNVDPMSFERKTRSGGKALKFYASHEIWLSLLKAIKKKERVIGRHVKAKITKNKLTGKVREIKFPIYYDYGVDNISSCVEWLVAEKFWKKKRLTICATELGIEATQSKVIDTIEKKNMEKRLTKIVNKRWAEVEDSLKLNRKRKYR